MSILTFAGFLSEEIATVTSGSLSSRRFHFLSISFSTAVNVCRLTGNDEYNKQQAWQGNSIMRSKREQKLGF